jgi:hypothetical protein
MKKHGCDYLFQLKKNQGEAFEAVAFCFQHAQTTPPDDVSYGKKGVISTSASSGVTSTTPSICATS